MAKITHFRMKHMWIQILSWSVTIWVTSCNFYWSLWTSVVLHLWSGWNHGWLFMREVLGYLSVLYKLFLLLLIIVHSSGCCKLHFIDNKTDLERLSVSFKDIQLVDYKLELKPKSFLIQSLCSEALCFPANTSHWDVLKIKWDNVPLHFNGDSIYYVLA